MSYIVGPMPSSIELTTNDGRSKINGKHIIFPICRKVKDTDNLEVLGTAFFITRDGLFLSAKHVFEDDRNFKHIYASEDPDGCNIWGLTFDMDGKTTYKKIPVAYIKKHDVSDIVIGKLVDIKKGSTGELIYNGYLTLYVPDTNALLTNTALKNRSFSETKKTEFPKGNPVSAFVYKKKGAIVHQDNKLKLYDPGQWIHGYIEKFYPDGVGLVKGPCFQTNLNTPHGASGGPVIIIMGNNGYACGVVSVGGGEESNPYTQVVPITTALDLKVQIQEETGEIIGYELNKLIELKYVKCYEYLENKNKRVELQKLKKKKRALEKKSRKKNR